MAVTMGQLVQEGPAAWRIRWTSNIPNATYRVFVNGKMVAQTQRTEHVLSGDLTDTHYVEVLDDENAKPKYAADNRALLAFNTLADVQQYNVEHDSGAGFSAAGEVPDTGVKRALFRSHALDPELTHSFRVKAVGNSGTVGTPATVTTQIARHSDVPRPIYTYDGAGPKTVTIS